MGPSFGDNQVGETQLEPFHTIVESDSASTTIQTSQPARARQQSHHTLVVALSGPNVSDRSSFLSEEQAVGMKRLLAYSL